MSTAGVVVCGSAAGTPDFICEHLRTKAQEAGEIFRDLTAVAAYDDHLHLARILLSLCGPRKQLGTTTKRNGRGSKVRCWMASHTTASLKPFWHCHAGKGA